MLGSADCGRSRRLDHIHGQLDEFGREIGKPFIYSLGRSEVYGHILAFDVTLFTEALPEGDNKMSAYSQGVRPENANARKFRQ
jgi:hypothetical protein